MTQTYKVDLSVWDHGECLFYAAYIKSNGECEMCPNNSEYWHTRNSSDHPDAVYIEEVMVVDGEISPTATALQISVAYPKVYAELQKVGAYT